MTAASIGAAKAGGYARYLERFTTKLLWPPQQLLRGWL
jgi:hypothetical protein